MSGQWSCQFIYEYQVRSHDCENEVCAVRIELVAAIVSPKNTGSCLRQ